MCHIQVSEIRYLKRSELGGLLAAEAKGELMLSPWSAPSRGRERRRQTERDTKIEIERERACARERERERAREREKERERDLYCRFRACSGGLQPNMCCPLPSEEGTTSNVFRTSGMKAHAGCGCDCLRCATQELPGQEVNHAAESCGGPVPMSQGPSYERCGTLCSSNPCIASSGRARASCRHTCAARFRAKREQLQMF